MSFESINLGGCVVQADVAETRRLYELISPGGESCECVLCRNARAAVPPLLVDKAVQTFASSLGIDLSKPSEYIDYGPSTRGHPGTRVIEAVYSVRGFLRLEDAGVHIREDSRAVPGFVPPSSRLHIASQPLSPTVDVFIKGDNFLGHASFDSEPAITVVICMTAVPWLLSDPPPD